MDKRTEKLADRWDSKRYFQSLAKAAHGLVEYRLMEGDTRTLAEALAALDSLSHAVEHALTPQLANADILEPHLDIPGLDNPDHEIK